VNERLANRLGESPSAQDLGSTIQVNNPLIFIDRENRFCHSRESNLEKLLAVRPRHSRALRLTLVPRMSYARFGPCR
jgi:hypothetical protein